VERRKERIGIPLWLLVLVLTSPTGVQQRGSNLTPVREFHRKTLLCKKQDAEHERRSEKLLKPADMNIY
jgi:hypothetical protein